ncbi:hypothetical protein QE152_g38646 [Popillia japonica]|uniref:Uncharacterized protein n=1 Tax=Popillia japonica TaxID=7064 RepID=A0AAW1HVX8_POPJA
MTANSSNCYADEAGQCRIAIQHNTNIRLQMTANSSNCYADEADILELADAANTQHDDMYFETTDNVDEAANTQHDDMYFETTDNVDEVVNVITANEENNEDESDSEDVLTINNQNATLETCSVVYVAGYLIHTVLRKKHCEDCAVALLKENSEMLENSEALLLNKNYF